MKQCISCKKWKDKNYFNKNNRQHDGIDYYCKECSTEKDNLWRENNQEKVILSEIKRRCNNKKCNRYYCYGKLGIKCLITAEEIRQLMIRDGYWDMKWPTIDRKDKTKNYTIDNCQFIEHFENTGKDKRIPILQYDLAGNFIKEWESQTRASKELKICQQNIGKVLKQKRHQTSGYIFRYK